MTISALLCLGTVLGLMCEGCRLEERRSAPLAEARIVRAGIVSSEDRVPIWRYGDLYAALGMTGEMFAEWEDRYGMDSLGVGGKDEILIRDFPVFSKVAWTYIDPVILSSSETAELAIECDRAALQTEDQSTRDTFLQIRDLALKAIREAATVRFGPPYST